MPEWVLIIVLVVSWQGAEFEISRLVYHETSASCYEQKAIIEEVMFEQGIEDDIESITCEKRINI